ncbi:AraC family transcriptional regulator [Paenibacillus senegalensis]|uniref:AraC family transcriptional regulator n=1 Tax=Paenibacillus senegalensis TaxID=1465766 RepID=UPI0002889FB5|nr:helix-turn-helix domain-containing protein [Paenibacillus senegalensis]
MSGHNTHLPTNRALIKDKIYIRYRESRRQSTWSLHSHDGYEIYYFIEGSAAYIIGNNIYNLLPGDMLLFQGSILHRVNPEVTGPYVRSTINFLPSLIERAVTREWLDKFIHLFEEPGGRLIRWSNEEEKTAINLLYEKMHQEKERELPGFHMMIQTHMVELMTVIYRKSMEIGAPNAIPNVTQKEMYVHRILTFINEHYKEPLSLDQIAASLHLNKYYMCHCFKEITGETINVYLSNRRLDEAKKLLRMTDLPIGRIFDEIGFNSAIHFSRLFKQHVGITPQTYRKLNRFYSDSTT